MSVTEIMESKDIEDLHKDCEHLTEMVKETINEVVSSKTWAKKHDTVVSLTTKELYEKIVRQYQACRPTQEEHKME